MADKKTSLSKQDIIMLRSEVIRCLNNYRNSIKTMDRLIKNIDEYDYPDEYEDIN